jgi:dihydroxyacetone synthase
MLQQANGIEQPKGNKDASVATLREITANSDAVHQVVRGWRPNLDDDDHAVLALRNLLFDICNQNGGGHGGSAIGMSAIGVALYKHVMRYNPMDPSWFDRDRFVLSNGTFISTNSS